MKNRKVIVVLAFLAGALLLLSSLGHQGASAIGGSPGNIDTVVGFGDTAGDDVPAVDSRLNYLHGVAVSTSGDVYVADMQNCRIRMVSAGTITTVAGSDSCGYSGDGGSALSAQLNGPQAVLIDSLGDLYIADTANCVIRLVSSGVISTVAGNGTCGYGGDGGAAASASLLDPAGLAMNASGDLYIADHGNCRIRLVVSGSISSVAGNGICAYSGDGGAATSASLQFPTGVAYDNASSILYIADRANCRVRQVSSGTITTFAGNGTCTYAGDGGSPTSASLRDPHAVQVDGSGNLYIADEGNCRVRYVSSGIISTFAGDGTCSFGGDGGAPTSASINAPTGVAVSSGGAVLIADYLNCRVRLVFGPTISTFAGNGICGYIGDGSLALAAALNNAHGIAFDSLDALYIVDRFHCRIRQVSGSFIGTIAGSGVCGFAGDGGSADGAQLNDPQAIYVDGSDNLLIGDTDNCRVRIVIGGVISTIAGNGTCGYGGDGGAATSASLNEPSGVVADGAGNVYIADYYNCRVRKVTGGTITTVAGNGTCAYSGDGGAATSASLNLPNGIAVDGLGNLYIADRYNCRIRKVTTGGTITTFAGNGTCGFSGDGGPATSASISGPHSVTFDSLGNLHITDEADCRIRKVSAVGSTISTVAGDGTCGFAGDGGAATSASLLYPTHVAFDSAGNMFISDTYNNRVRVVYGNVKSADSDGDGCPNVREQQVAPGSELTGGLRNYLDPNDYFNPSGDLKNRVDDILLVVQAYFEDDADLNPGLPPYVSGYDPKTDRTLVGPNPWNLGPPNGLQRVDDILHSVRQYFHDCV